MMNTKSSSQFLPSACHVLPARNGTFPLTPFVTERNRMRVIPLREPEFAATALRNHREDCTCVRLELILRVIECNKSQQSYVLLF